MSKAAKNAVSPSRSEDFPEWYQQVIRAADLAENSEVRGCMVIKPWGYGIWEQMQQKLDQMIKDTGHVNAYFPLLIPLSYLEKEAEHAEGFATECAVVTHHRLEAEKQDDGTTKMIPTGKLAEPYIIRPTSETIIGAAYARWVQSYRDLPILINQWANVMRWEMRPRLFLRTTEFLWQEGHTAHETKEEAIVETEKMHEVYETFMRDYLAVPVIPGEKSEAERFPGAERTLTVEAMVQDRKAIQAGTSHFLGQNFAKAAGIEFQGRNENKEHAWTTSWGVSTRMVGMVIMAHGDDDGVFIPPRIAPQQIVILPIIPKDEHREAVLEAAESFAAKLRAETVWGNALRVHIDSRDLGGGAKNWDWIKKGVPVRIEIGPRDLEKGTVAIARRDKGHKEKDFVKMDEAITQLPTTLEEIQSGLLERALAYREEHTKEIDTLEEFRAFFTAKNPEKPEIHGGFALAHWGGTAEDEDRLSKEMKVTIRCIPNSKELGGEPGVCFYTGNPSKQRLVFAKSY